MPYSETEHTRFVSTLLASVSYSSNFTNTFFSRLYRDLKLPAQHVGFSGKTIIVTGANSGIGFEIARVLARMGASIVLACRSPDRGEVAKARIIDEAKEQNAAVNVEVEGLDLSRFVSVREFVERWGRRKSTHLDVLINNAGAIYATLSTTPDGIESQYQINHLSHFLITTLFLNRGYMSSDARIINVSTGAFYSSEVLTRENSDGKDIMAKHKHQPGVEYGFPDMMQLYGRSKAALVVWTIALQKRLEQSERWNGVTVHVCNPCPSNSMLWHQPSAIATDAGTRFFKSLATKVISHASTQGAIVPVWLATASKPAEPEWRGMYWDRMQWQWVPAWTLEHRKQNELWERWCHDVNEVLAL